MVGLVYFIRAIDGKGPIKIGHSKVPANRLMSFQMWCPFEIQIAATVEGDFKLEQNLHDVFFEWHIRGEWFKPAPALIKGIAKLCLGFPVDVAFDLTNKTGNLRSKRVRASRFYSTEFRQRLSYKRKLMMLGRRRDKDGFDAHRVPRTADDILGYKNRHKQLTFAEIDHLEAILADPNQHFLTSEQKYPEIWNEHSSVAA